MTNIKRANTSGITKTGTAISDVPDAPTIGTATASALTASVTFTQAVTGGAPTSFTVTSSPGGFTGTGASAPITVSGLSDGTSYTFTVTSTNAAGTSPASSASNSITAALPMEGAYDSLGAVTLSATASSVSFTGIPSGYKHLQLRFIGRTAYAGTTDYINLVFNGNTSSSTSYWFHFLRGNGSAADASSSGAFYAFRAGFVTGNTATSGVFGAGVIDILEYADTNKNKTARIFNGEDRNGAGNVALWSGGYTNTSAITSIQLTGANGDILANSSFALYGVK